MSEESESAIPRYFSSLVSRAARSDEHTVTLRGQDGYIGVYVDDVQLLESGLPSETFGLPSDWPEHLTEDGREKAQEVGRSE